MGVDRASVPLRVSSGRHASWRVGSKMLAQSGRRSLSLRLAEVRCAYALRSYRFARCRRRAAGKHFRVVMKETQSFKSFKIRLASFYRTLL
jgi:hypothetical protein